MRLISFKFSIFDGLIQIIVTLITDSIAVIIHNIAQKSNSDIELQRGKNNFLIISKIKF